MRIAIASDHAGFSFKESLKEYLASQGHNVTDCGPATSDRCDYPDFGSVVAKKVSAGEVHWGLLICGSGMGMCMVANRYKGVRAAVLRDEDDAVLSREHNNANVACFGARITDLEKVKGLINLFFSTKFTEGRHTVRVKKIDKLP